MCTLTFLKRHNNSFLITMNRDDLKERIKLECPPVINKENGFETMMPVDGLQGGTWIASNTKGEVFCLLNRYDNINYQPQTSRGHIIPYLSKGGEQTEVTERLQFLLQKNLFSPFTLLYIRFSIFIIFEWDGQQLKAIKKEMPTEKKPFVISSSSWKTQEVLTWRYKLFSTWVKDGGAFKGKIPFFHLICPKRKEEWAPFVNREKVCTSSITQILLSVKKTKMTYFHRKEFDSSA